MSAVSLEGWSNWSQEILEQPVTAYGAGAANACPDLREPIRRYEDTAHVTPQPTLSERYLAMQDPGALTEDIGIHAFDVARR